MRCSVMCKHYHGISYLNQPPICNNDEDKGKEMNNEYEKSYDVDEDDYDEESEPWKKRKSALFNN